MQRFDLVHGKMVETADGNYVYYDGGGQWMDCTESEIKRPDYLPSHNSRPLADFIQEWLASNGITDIRTIYHNPFPVGFVMTCIDRYERAEQLLREIKPERFAPHHHVSGDGDKFDTCKACGHDIRNEIHIRA